jgi:hypothetical protein
MKARFLAGVYRLSDPSVVALTVSLLTALLVVIGALLPAEVAGGLLADPISGGSSNGGGG